MNQSDIHLTSIRYQRRGQAGLDEIKTFQDKNVKKNHTPMEAMNFLNQLQNTSNLNDPNIDNHEKLKLDGINMLIYGTFLKKLKAKGNDSNLRFFFLSDEDISYVYYFSKAKPIRKTRINLKKIINISIGSHPLKNAPFMNTITLETKNNKNFTFIFDTEIQKMMIGQAFDYLVIQAQNNTEDEATAEQKKEKVVEYLKKNDPNQLKNLTPQNLDNLFEVYQNSVGKVDSIRIADFAVLMDDLTSKKEIFELFRRYCKAATTFEALSDDDLTMSLEEIKNFWKVEQHQDLYPKDFEFVIKGFLKDNIFSNNRFIQGQKEIQYEDYSFSFNNFAKILFHSSNSIFNKELGQIYQPMTNPLTDYYICSSHNTYLEGNQFQGISSTQAYIDALSKGCRCVEIDCWDGSDGEPIVYHGYTLTTKIKFIDVIQTIAQYAFKWSEYPLILSLEVHCSYEQQGRMAAIMTEEFYEIHEGKKRFMVYLLPKDFNKVPNYPCPENLKRCILIKGKGSLETIAENDNDSKKGRSNIVSRVYLNKWREAIMRLWQEQAQMTVKTREKEQQLLKKYSVVLSGLEEKVEEFKDQFRELEEKKFHINLYNKRSRSAGRASFLNLASIDDYDAFMNMKNFPSRITQNRTLMIKQMKEDQENQKIISNQPTKDNEKLEKMVTLFNTPFDVESAKDRSFWQISSLDEYKIQRLVAGNIRPMGDFHRFYFSRIYPSGQRVQSSNYDPLTSFLSGSQIVALNFQTVDLPLFVLLSKFQENGGLTSGYLLKPPYMRLDSISPKYPEEFRKIDQKITIKVISAQHLRSEIEGDVKNNINPQVHVYLKGSLFDETQNITFKTKIVKRNGFNPRFDSQDLKFNISTPDHSLIMFEVFNSDQGKGKKARLGWYGLPINCIRQGYRVVPLRNSKFKIISDSFLFVNIKVEKQ